MRQRTVLWMTLLVLLTMLTLWRPLTFAEDFKTDFASRADITKISPAITAPFPSRGRETAVL